MSSASHGFIFAYDSISNHLTHACQNNATDALTIVFTRCNIDLVHSFRWKSLVSFAKVH
ncbi:MAG: hypothetical protein ACI89U_000397 [Gammaproteobacteria bacterium]